MKVKSFEFFIGEMEESSKYSIAGIKNKLCKNGLQKLLVLFL
jgi:hypothetical protein